ncbi:amidohydrolase family protein [uncultured Sphingomonas sp.]|uniref:amidohydrolase family protein n=1 Tax=uncultured Sphingomonas sp. TaxID=158754 RepID=UPI00261B354D|nr:amidohydrolase family protein [uncultured Sphingomonas sp.]
MPRPRDISAIDTLIGFRDVETHRASTVPGAKLGWDKHPAEYMFKDTPDDLAADVDPMSTIDETLAAMDKHNVGVGVIHLTDERAETALRCHPDRFVGVKPIDANLGMDAVRTIQRLHDEFDIRGITMFPSGLKPTVPINDRRWYPIYAKCIELDIAAFCTTGVPGPRVPFMPQYVGHIDEVCYDLPELKFVMRHGAEPWEDLAIKLLMKWPNLYYSTSAFAPKYWPDKIVEFANKRGADKVIYAGYYPMGLELDRIFREMDDVPFRDDVWPKFLRDNAAKVLRIIPPASRR